jgi:hypothetical protein
VSNRSYAGHQRRVLKLKARIASEANDHMPRCTVPDPTTGKPCGRPTARAAKQGLSAFTCRFHQAHLQRHGSTWCKSPTAAVLKPYLSAALAYIKAHRNDLYVSAALAGLGGLMQAAGPVVIATRLRGMPPARRARVALARMRQAKVKPERLLAISLAVSALIEAAPATVHRTRDYYLTAIAKAAHRSRHASGYHRVWEVRDDNGRVVQRTQLKKYPRSSGRVLRHLGALIFVEAELTIYHHLPGVLALKAARDACMMAPPAAP